MQLWSDYEGRTIAEDYPLKKLVRPEGRSAFFLTTNGTGTQALVRLIEAHFDESEILKRWSTVSEIKQENLVAMRKFGETSLDGTPLLYAVMEPTDISLAELLESRTLTVEEARQLATSLVAALTALHERGLVHGHIDTENILAAGETVKLSSDCVRDANDDPEKSEAARKAADAHALAEVLLEALTGRRTLQGSATLLPSPFDGIIRNGLSGKWSLKEMAAALGPVSPAQAAAATTTPAATPPKPAATTTSAAPVAATAPVATPPAPTPAAKPKPQPSAPLFEKLEATEAAQTRPTSKPAATPAQAPDVRQRLIKAISEDETGSQKQRTRILIGAAAVLLVVLFFAWRMLRSEPEDASTPASAQAAQTQSAAPEAAAAPAPPPASTPAPAPAASPSGKSLWRVVAFTYNHQDQAQHKAETIRSQHPSLNPEVFTPTGRAPYLVTVGGPMSRNDAESFRRKARSEGMPRDVYAQNFPR
ncbi:MAG TPA: hypothetical protein VGB69_09795 [Edaphobacter sp.]